MGAMGFSIYIRDRNAFVKQAIDQGWAVIHTANTVASSAIKNKNYPLLNDIMKNLKNNDFILDAAIIDLQGNVVAASSPKNAIEVGKTSKALVTSLHTEDLRPIKDEKGKIVALAFTSAIIDESVKALGYFNLLVDFSKINANLEQTAYQMITSFVIAALAGLIIVRRIVVKSVGKPVKALLEATEKVSVGDFSYTLPVVSHDELGHLAHAFNVMSDQLGVLFNSIKSIVGDMNSTSSMISKRTEPSGGPDMDAEDPGRQYEILKEINSNAKRLTRMSHQLNSLALQFKTAGEQ
jgi:methyl-accepting chemotaxis protein